VDDAGRADGGALDGGRADAAAIDGGRTDGGVLDAGPGDAGATSDAGPGEDAGRVDPCEPVGGTFDRLGRSGPATDRPAAAHGDLNLALRGWTPAAAPLALVDYDGPTDGLAPRLETLFADDRVPGVVAAYRVNDWDWGCDCRGAPIDDWPATLIGVRTTPGEPIELADSGYDVGGGHDALVLYADDRSITLKYTREDNVVSGYTLHVDGVCVDPALRRLYDMLDAGGRAELPALRGNQPFARARSTEVRIAIRDTGAFMDPRSRKDWWPPRP
jgi:hypothetical protein